MGLVRVPELCRECCELRRLCRSELRNGFEQPVALDNPLGVHTDEASEMPLQRALIEAVPSASDAESLAELKQRVDATIVYLRALPPRDLEAGLDRVIEMQRRGASKQFTGGQFLLEFAIPNFFFHVTVAYGILRHEGVALTTGDFLGSASS